MNIKFLLVLILLLLVTLFSVQNAGMITVRFLAWQFTMSQALVIMVAAGCGGLAGAIAGALTTRRKPGTKPAATPTPGEDI